MAQLEGFQCKQEQEDKVFYKKWKAEKMLKW